VSSGAKSEEYGKGENEACPHRSANLDRLRKEVVEVGVDHPDRQIGVANVQMVALDQVDRLDGDGLRFRVWQ
jgi:hypothetical protein